MNARISMTFLTAYFVLLLFSGFLVSAPWDCWAWCAITGTCAVVAIWFGPRWHRVIGGVCAALVLLLALVAFHGNGNGLVLPVRFNRTGTPTFVGVPLSHQAVRRSVFACCGHLGIRVSVPADETQWAAVGNTLQELRAAKVKGVFRSPP